MATRDGQAAQARRYTREADAVLASGERSRGSWILAEFSRRDPSTYEKTSERYLYGLAFVRLASRRWMHVRVIVTFTGTCAEADRRGRSFTAALARLLRTARVAARLVAKRPA